MKAIIPFTHPYSPEQLRVLESLVDTFFAPLNESETLALKEYCARVCRSQKDLEVFAKLSGRSLSLFPMVVQKVSFLILLNFLQILETAFPDQILQQKVVLSMLATSPVLRLLLIIGLLFTDWRQACSFIRLQP